uniref:Uncharacterized protein n=1 Tax=Chromera velia CCMP2878 TaxID=1169474 RepID=A0A0G4GC75_9ALVE|eukprot:Cvel_4508.t1-p1 / transcript=Cvel_4508.t1 / gene=Cvel_4508 / organism=Chromera_velia_CCMP2878 / gene_product=hypothetical protein / transcript_product=hypothetical protein / location=Cvel_scaffold197:64760-67387(-) / protein_length=199 / sequence_SO=supercontig / SO=protein_coding / is_pseudo=false
MTAVLPDDCVLAMLDMEDSPKDVFFSLLEEEGSLTRGRDLTGLQDLVNFLEEIQQETVEERDSQVFRKEKVGRLVLSTISRLYKNYVLMVHEASLRPLTSDQSSDPKFNGLLYAIMADRRKEIKEASCPYLYVKQTTEELQALRSMTAVPPDNCVLAMLDMEDGPKGAFFSLLEKESSLTRGRDLTGLQDFVNFLEEIQ